MGNKSFNDIISNAAKSKFPIEKNRYLLYVSFTCPFAHRSSIVRELKGLQEYLPLVHTHYHLDSDGWRFATKEELASVPEGDITYGTAEPVYGFDRISKLYKKANPDYEGRWTVPALFDKKTETIVNNESGEQVRFFNTEFNEVLPEKYAKVDVYPKELQKEIEEFNEKYGDPVTFSFVKASFAENQEDFEAGFKVVLEKLSALDEHLAETQKSGSIYVVGSQITEADIKLYTTIVRFGRLYYRDGEVKRISFGKDYPHIHKWLKHLYSIPAFKDTTDFEQLLNGSEARTGKKVPGKFSDVLDLD